MLGNRLLRSGPAFSAILMYHRVLPDDGVGDWPLRSLVVYESVFREQVRWMAETFEIRTVPSMLDSKPADTSGRPRLAITFDDGYWDNALVAAPILESAGVRGTFFITTGFLGTNKRLWFDVAARVWVREHKAGKQRMRLHEWMRSLKEMRAEEIAEVLRARTTESDWISEPCDRAMTGEELRGIARAGHEIGCHTRTHPILTRLADLDIRAEISGSVLDLRALGCKVRGIAYPNGNYDPRVLDIAGAEGLDYGVTTEIGCIGGSSARWPRLSLPRIDVNMERLNRWSRDPADALFAELSWQTGQR